MSHLYYLVSFKYPGPRGSQPGDWDKEGKEVPGSHDLALIDAEKALWQLLKHEGVDFRHAYSWPDGSLYLYIRSEASVEALRALLDTILSGTPLSVESVSQEEPTNNPYKVGCETVEAYFDHVR